MRTPYSIENLDSNFCTIMIGEEQVTGGITRSDNNEQALQAIWTLEHSPRGYTFKIIDSKDNRLENGIYKLEVLKNPLTLKNGKAIYFVDGFYLNEQLEIIGEAQC